MPILRIFVTSFLAFLILACSTHITATQTQSNPSPSPANTSAAVLRTNQPIITEAVTEILPTPEVISCNDWQSWPVVPTVGKTAHELFQRGQEIGNNSRAFSKIGDGEISTDWFFTAFDLGEDYYGLGPYQDLISVIEHFQGSFERIGMAARRGFNTQRILDLSESDPKLCASGELPLTCELRLQRPAFAILSLGTNQVWQPEEFERGMRQILKILLSQNVVPILSTKGDNLEGDHRINRTIVCLAQEYDVPLWNFWLAVQPLPNHGLQPDREHLTYGITDFDDEHAMQTAWTVRNLTALQALDAVWRGVTTQP